MIEGIEMSALKFDEGRTTICKRFLPTGNAQAPLITCA
jgi:hypothetical protein